MTELTNKIGPVQEVKVYKTRWLILVLYIISCASSTMQWIQYSIIADTIVDYYEITYAAVDWTAMVYLLMFAIFGWGGSCLLDILGLRMALLTGMVGTCVGAWLKLISVSPDKFWIVILGQSIIGLSEIFMLPVPSKLAAVWFGPKEVSTACSLGLFGTQIGIGTGFLIPPIIINSQASGIATREGLYIMLTTVAVLNTFLLITLFFFFKDRPPSPPSQAQLKKEEKQTELANLKQSLNDLFTNRSYVLLIISHGMGTGVSYAIMQMLNQIILKYYENGAADAGRIGLILILVGMISCIICGIVLDKFNRFKETIATVHVLTIASMLILTFTLDKGIVYVYLSSALFGFFVMGYIPTGCELAAELTYPIDEGLSSGILFSSSQFFGILFTYVYSYLLNTTNDKIANLVMVAVLGVAMILLYFIHFDLRRRKLQEETKEVLNVRF